MITVDSDGYITNEKGEVIAEIQLSDEIQRMKRILESWPDLLAACEWLISELEIKDEGQRMTEKTIETIRVAIAKAKGK